MSGSRHDRVLVTGATGRIWRRVVGRLLEAGVTSTVRDVLGTPPRTFAQWATDHARAFSS